MQLTIPEGAQVSITVGHPLPLAVDGPSRAWPAEMAPLRRPGRPVLKAIGVAALVGVAFVAGQHTGWRSDVARAVAAPLASAPLAPSAATPQPAQHAFPDHPLPHSQPPLGPGQPSRDVLAPPPPTIPQVFRDTLAQPPLVTPAPGVTLSPGGVTPAAPSNLFGLHE